MENIHEIDSNTVETLINMFNSDDETSVKMGLTILNNANFNDPKIVEYVNELNTKCYDLHFALFQNKKGDIRARFAYITHVQLRRVGGRQMVMIDDDSTLDNDEWFPYEPSIDPSQNLKFKYNKK